MQVRSMFFKPTASIKLDDPVLQRNMKHARGKFVDGRARGVAEVDNWEAIRTYAAELRDRTIANLDAYLVEFERNATRRGARVHWAETAEEACDIEIEVLGRTVGKQDQYASAFATDPGDPTSSATSV